MKNIKQNGIIYRKMHWNKYIIVPVVVVLFIFSVNIAISPRYKIRELENLAMSDTSILVKTDSIYNHPSIVTLQKEKAYKEALFNLSEKDSIQMVVNLSDSTVNLSIHGVTIHQTKVRTFKKDKLFGVLSFPGQMYLFSRPFQVNAQYATIVKEPIVVRHAPKDTLEAAVNVWQPDTLIQNPAYLILTLPHNIDLIFEQDNNPTFRDKWKKFDFYNRLRWQKTVNAISNFANLRKQDYHPTITIQMPVDDLRAIYRALPNQAYVVINT